MHVNAVDNITLSQGVGVLVNPRELPPSAGSTMMVLVGSTARIPGGTFGQLLPEVGQTVRDGPPRRARSARSSPQIPRRRNTSGYPLP